jgi:fatty acid desaturase
MSPTTSQSTDDTEGRAPGDAIDEAAIVRKYTGGVGWPTVVLCGALVAGYVGVIVGWSAGIVPAWAGCAVNSALTYAFYTVHHDANHKAVSGRNARWSWLDPACGSIAAIPLQLSFRGFSSAHLRHHANTNDPLRDPDALVAGPLKAVPVKGLIGTITGVVGALPWGDRFVAKVLAPMMPKGRSESTRRAQLERKRMRRYSRIGLIVLVASIPAGMFAPVFLLWWLPGRLAVLALMVLFQWLPHFPYDSTERFHNTRITTFRFSTWLLLQQDRHLIHHLYPSIPWYRYRAVFREIRPLLLAEGATIEGRDAAPSRPIQLRTVT